jgi:hypothetical protein
METRGHLREMASLRFRLQTNRRLRLETLAAVSKVFREYGEPIEDELLASIVFAVPEELYGEGGSIQAVRSQSYPANWKGADDSPSLAVASDYPGAPDLPEMEEEPGAPDLPEMEEEPGAPDLPEMEEEPGAPDLP